METAGDPVLSGHAYGIREIVIAVRMFYSDIGLGVIEGIDGEDGVADSIDTVVAEVGVAERSVDEYRPGRQRGNQLVEIKGDVLR